MYVGLLIIVCGNVGCMLKLKFNLMYNNNMMSKFLLFYLFSVCLGGTFPGFFWSAEPEMINLDSGQLTFLS